MTRKLQDIDKIYNWSKKWEMEFNVKKCKVLEMEKGNMRSSWNYKWEATQYKKQRKRKTQES